MSNPGNAINEATTGICGFTSTAFVGSPATQHCVQIGAATTSTLSSVTNGTTGQFLGANTGADPTFQSIPSSFSPNSTVNYFEDFIGYQDVSVNNYVANLSWNNTDSQHFVAATSSSFSGNPGLISNQLSSVGTGIMLGKGSGVSGIVLGGGALTINWVFNIVNLSSANPRYTLRMGLGDTQSADQVNGVYFEYSDNLNSGNWVYKTASASSRTSANSSIAVTSGWHNAQISINAAGTSIAFSMDGVSLGTAATLTIPAVIIVPFFNFIASVGTVTANSFYIDLMYFNQTLTTPR